MIRTILISMLGLCLFGCGEPTEVQEATLGTISFTPYGKEIAQPHFERGLLLLHSFEYKDARTSFLKAQELDPDFHMAYWGEAMTHDHPLWSSQYTDEGREALNKLAPSAEEREKKAQSEIERDLIRGVNIMYDDAIEDQLERDVAYSAYMATLHEKYEGNNEVSAFYALSILGSVAERDEKTYEKGALIAQGILEENPNHPGALHYLIHSYDDPAHASMALDAANKYSKVAPDAGHALHMPSHIYVALGMWDEVVSSNIASYAASNERRIRLDLDSDARNYHALRWLMYGHMQRNELDKARALLMDMNSYCTELPSTRARAYLINMRADYLVGSGDWSDDELHFPVDDEDLNVQMRATNSFVKGMVAYSNEDVPKLESVITLMQSRREEESKKMLQRGSSSCSGVGWATQLPTQADINIAHVMEMELQALRSMLVDDPLQAEIWLNTAVELEDNTAFNFGPPSIVKPSHELYGEWLISQNMEVEAIVQYEKALEKTPGRRLVVEGMKGKEI